MPLQFRACKLGRRTRFFTKEEIARAVEVRRIQHVIGWPSDGAFEQIIAQNMLNNCSITIKDVARAEAMYGKVKPLCKGKMTKASNGKTQVQKIPLPVLIVQHHRNISLYINIFSLTKFRSFTPRVEKLFF